MNAQPSMPKRGDAIIARVFRYLLYSLLGLIVVAGAGLTLAVYLIDPNDYRPQLERLVADKTRLQLQLQGDIGWSLMPLGIEVNQLDARLDDEDFLAIDRLVARVGLLSLLKMQPAVHSFVLHGLDLNLQRDASGSGNWERIMVESAEPTPTEPVPTTDEGDKDALQVQIRSVDIARARVRYHDAASGQSLTLDELALTASAIAPGEPFPLSLSFHFANAEPQLDLRTELSATVTMDEKFERFQVDDLRSTFELAGAAVNQQQLTASASGNLTADLPAETLQLKAFSAALANLSLNTDLTVTGFGEQAQLRGTLAIPAFSPRELLQKLGQPALDTQDPKALSKLSLNTDIGGEPGVIALSALTLNLDDSRLTGTASYTLENGAIDATLQLDQLNADRYLPPETETAAADDTPDSEAAPETDLLPLETLRELRWRIALDAGEIRARNIPITQLTLRSTARDGLIEVKPLGGKLYQGSFTVAAKVDASRATPRWDLDTAVDQVELMPLLTELADMRQFSGRAVINSKLSTRGNRVSALRENAKGQADFAVASGTLEGTNLAAFACQGIARINGESIDTSGWPKTTPFEDLGGALTINGHTLNNTALKAQLKGMALEGQGTVDIKELLLDYRAGLRILGAVHDAPACRVNERLTNLVIPVRCTGPLAGEEGLPCRFDSARFADVIKDQAKGEIKQKADAEADRARERLKDKARDKFEGLFK